MLPDAVPEVACPECGFTFTYDEIRRCYRCDGAACCHCLTGNPEPLCPECQPAEMPRHVHPMLAVLSELPKDEKNWGIEYKWDGIRILTYWDGETLKLETRNLLSATIRYPEFSDLGQALGDCSMILDGEVVALDERNRPNFSLLERRMHLSPAKVRDAAAQIPVWYFIFDILYLNGRDLTSLPYQERRQILDGLKIDHPRCKLSPWYIGEAETVLEVAKERGLEGVIAKRLTSPYQPGMRSPDWRKVKIVSRQEFVIGGWSPERTRADRIGSLLLGYYEDGKLRYAGRVGSGFGEAEHKLLREVLAPLATKASPFADLVPAANFVEPKLVADVEYRRWFPGGRLQQTAFKGLREDKPASEVVRERKE